MFKWIAFSLLGILFTVIASVSALISCDAAIPPSPLSAEIPLVLPPQGPAAPQMEDSANEFLQFLHKKISKENLKGFAKAEIFARKHFGLELALHVERWIVQKLQSLQEEEILLGLELAHHWLAQHPSKALCQRLTDISPFLWTKRHHPRVAEEVADLVLRHGSRSQVEQLKDHLSQACHLCLKADDADTLLVLVPLLDDLQIDPFGGTRHVCGQNFREDARFLFQQCRLEEAQTKLLLANWLSKKS